MADKKSTSEKEDKKKKGNDDFGAKLEKGWGDFVKSFDDAFKPKDKKDSKDK